MYCQLLQHAIQYYRNFQNFRAICVLSLSLHKKAVSILLLGVLAVAWFQENMMEANPLKFQALVLQNTETPFTIGEITIKSEKHVTLLGVSLDNKYVCEDFHSSRYNPIN